MTTTDPVAALVGAAPAGIDDAVIDGIAANLYDALLAAAAPAALVPGAPTPGGALPTPPVSPSSVFRAPDVAAPPSGIPAGIVPEPPAARAPSTAGAPSFYFLPDTVPDLAGVPGVVVPTASLPGATTRTVPSPGGVVPGAPAAVVPPAPAASAPGGRVPGVGLIGTSPPLSVPTVGVGGVALPGFLDETIATRSAAAVGAPPYYLPGSGDVGAVVPAWAPASGVPGMVVPSASVPGATTRSAPSPDGVVPGASATVVPASPGGIPGIGSLSALPFDVPPPDVGGALAPNLVEAPAPRGVPTDAGAQPYYLAAPASAPAPATSAAPLETRPTFEVEAIRRDFPILQERVHGKPLVWLDNAATTQKPRAVLDRMARYYEHEYSNVHRAAHTLAARSTDAYEGARQKVQRFLGAASSSEIVFVRGTTEAINLVANTWGRHNLVAGDEIVVTTLEHHSNIVPWQFLAQQLGVVLKVVPVTDRGEVLLEDYGRLLGPRTRLVAVTHVSNALGTVLPVGEMIQAAHRHGATVLIDGAQAVSHFPVNVQALDADFYVLSGHKLFAPTGVGVLYGKQAILEHLPPWQGGGNMIQRVTFEHSTFADPPARFEAGTATLADAVGLGAAVEYLERVGMPNVARHEHELLVHATEDLGKIKGVHLIGTAPEKAGVVSFLAEGIPAEDMGRILDQDGIAVRAGHHCAQPTMDRFGVTGTVRPSFALYNTHYEIEVLVRAVRRALRR